jgi:hypothetical protein
VARRNNLLSQSVARASSLSKRFCVTGNDRASAAPTSQSGMNANAFAHAAPMSIGLCSESIASF